VVAVRRVVPWEKLVAMGWRFEVFGLRFSEKRWAAAIVSVIVSRNGFPDLCEWIVKRPFIEHFSPSVRTAIRHGRWRVSKVIAVRVRSRLIRFLYPES
jgi:hypothetical protein